MTRDKNRKHFQFPHNIVLFFSCSFPEAHVFSTLSFCQMAFAKTRLRFSFAASNPISRRQAFEDTQRGEYRQITGGDGEAPRTATLLNPRNITWLIEFA